jgi:uncharacterized coiled-coil protein SlyX
MTDPHPKTDASGAARGHLRAVGALDSAPAATPARPVAKRGGAFALLVVAFGAVALWLAVEVRYAARLEAQIEGLGHQLAETREALEAHRARLSEVRGRVSGLRAEVASLDALLETEPTPSSAPNAEPGAAAAP